MFYQCMKDASFPSPSPLSTMQLALDFSPDNVKTPVKSPTDYFYCGSNGLGHRIQNNEKVLGEADVMFLVS